MSLPKTVTSAQRSKENVSPALTAHQFSLRVADAVPVLGAALGVFGEGGGCEEGCEEEGGFWGHGCGGEDLMCCCFGVGDRKDGCRFVYLFMVWK